MEQAAHPSAERSGHRTSPLTAQFSRFARVVNDFVSSPAATFAAFAIVVAWALSGPHFHYSDGWQLVINTGTTIVTFLMVFVLNNAQSRDTAAMNSKLDALILSIESADNRLIGLERKTDADVEELRDHIREASDAEVSQLRDELSEVTEATKPAGAA